MIEERCIHLEARRPRFHLTTSHNCGRVEFATEHSFISGHTAFPHDATPRHRPSHRVGKECRRLPPRVSVCLLKPSEIRWPPSTLETLIRKMEVAFVSLLQSQRLESDNAIA